MTCTFFGHRDTPKSIEPILQRVLIDLIENKKVDLFYIGNNGSFDLLIKRNLQILKNTYPHIKYFIVLAYFPHAKYEENFEDYSKVFFPEILEQVPPKFAIDRRNKWMIDRSDYVIVYVKYPTGCAKKFKDLAERKNKIVLNLADIG